VKWSTKKEQNINQSIRVNSSTGIKGITLRRATGYHKDRYIVKAPLTSKVLYSGYSLEKAKDVLLGVLCQKTN